MSTLKIGSRGPEVRALQSKLNLAVDGIFGPITEEGVKAFQADHGLTVDGIAGRKTLAALALESPCNRRIDKIIVHCTATPEGRDFTVEEIDRCHKARGFKGIGYHYVVYRDGSIHYGRPVEQIGAHTSGYNAHSIGVCYVGGCDAHKLLPNGQPAPKDTRTPEQRHNLRAFVEHLKALYPGATVHGHYEFANKACPSFKIEDL